MLNLFNRITGMFCHASELDIEDDHLDDEEGSFRVCYPEDFDPLYQGDLN